MRPIDKLLGVCNELLKGRIERASGPLLRGYAMLPAG
jgi:hypothetical protein